MRLSPFSIITVFVALMIIGLAFVPRLGIQLHPQAELPALRVSFTWTDTPAIQVEREVTSKIESALSTIIGIEEVSSVSSFGMGSVDIKVGRRVNLEMLRFKVSSSIRRLFPSFPQGVSYPSVELIRAAGRQTPLLTYNIVAPVPTQTISQYMEQFVFPNLAQIRGLDEVNLFGANPLEYQVIYNTQKLELWNISVQDLRESIQAYFGNHFLGFALANEQDNGYAGKIPVSLRAGNISGEPMWEKIPLANRSGRIIYLTDVASVRLVETVPFSYFRVNGKTTLLMVIEAARGVNQISLSDQIRYTLDGLQQQMPEGWQMILTYDDTQFIRTDLQRAGTRMLISFGVLMLFVMLVTRNARYLLMIFITMVANLLLAVTWYYFLGIEIHLYSLAGITLSLGIIIDNCIVMIEHLRSHGNKKVFVAILAATLTTVGSLSVIFLLGHEQQLMLRDFAGVVLVNLLLSVGIAWFFIPALFVQFKMKQRQTPKVLVSARRVVSLTRRYLQFISLARRRRCLVLLILILGFGIPVHLLPREVPGESLASRLYNQTIGSPFYQQNIKGIAENVLGGTLRLFSQYVFDGAFFTDPERTTIHIRGMMPDGSTIHQLNDAVVKMENFLRGFGQIEQFQTRIVSPRNGTITVFFRPEYEIGAFPFVLQNQIIQKALHVGGAEWSVMGVGQGFSNVLRRGWGSMLFRFEGYNYDQLYQFAETLKTWALENPRVRTPRIFGTDPWASILRNEFFMEFDENVLALHNLSIPQVFQGLQERIMKVPAANIFYNYRQTQLSLIPHEYREYTLWDLAHKPLQVAGAQFTPNELLQVEKRATGKDIFKHNQQYRISLSMDFVGPHHLQERVSENLLESIQQILPMGYNVSLPQWRWEEEAKQNYLLILLVVVIIFFICAILLESLLQPLAILSLIPVSFAGLFLTFFLFDLNFDQGGWAAFILLSGLSVNAGLFILSDFNRYRRTHPHRNPLFLYMKAFQHKIFPVMLTIVSSIIGLVPFIIGEREVFWFAFAAGTIGGLIFSILAVWVFFPVFLTMGNKKGGKTKKGY